MEPIASNTVPQIQSTQTAQPAQNTAQNAAQKREINRPKVGVVDVPTISTTPMSDTIAIKKREHPKPKIQLPKKSKKNLNFYGALSAFVGTCGLVSLISLFKRK